AVGRRGRPRDDAGSRRSRAEPLPRALHSHHDHAQSFQDRAAMRLDIESFVLVTAAAALLMGGGAFLRGSFGTPKPAQPGPELGWPPPAPPPEEVDRRVREAEEAVSALSEQVSQANVARENQHREMVDLRKRLEKQLLAAEDETKRMAGDLATEKARIA